MAVFIREAMDGKIKYVVVGMGNLCYINRSSFRMFGLWLSGVTQQYTMAFRLAGSQRTSRSYFI